MKNGSSIVTFYNRSSKAYANLFENQETLNGADTALRHINAVDTRWNSEYKKEVRLPKIKNTLSISMNEGNCSTYRSPSKWKVSANYCEVLSGLDVATAEASKEMYSSISLVIPLLHIVSEKRNTLKQKPVTREFAQQVQDSLHHRFPNLKRRNKLYVSSSSLDARFKDIGSDTLRHYICNERFENPDRPY